MRRFKILHRTYYNFTGTVRLEPHTLRLRPKEGHDLRIESASLDITPAATLRWHSDVEGRSPSRLPTAIGFNLRYVGLGSGANTVRFNGAPQKIDIQLTALERASLACKPALDFEVVGGQIPGKVNVVA